MMDTNRQILPAAEVLASAPGLWNMDENERFEMTISCRDTDYIEKVKEAGEMKEVNGTEVQVMHNGLIVESGGYHGDWMSKVISSLGGHHEPQEEKVFYEVLKRIEHGGAMIELGAFWAYYSLWFNKQIPKSNNICCEPDPVNLALGQRNAILNGAENIDFIRAAAGSKNGEIQNIVMESSMQPSPVMIRSVDSLMDEFKWSALDILHIDVQGFEHDALLGAKNTINNGKLRFIFVSSHHYLFSNDPDTHGECVDFIKDHGGHIISSHTVAESFSGDGLIVASFDNKDKDLQIDMSLNHTDHSLFRPGEKDLYILWQEYNKLQKKCVRERGGHGKK